MESERLKLSRERQLASAIEQFQNVAKAQVLLAIPKDNVFARNERKPSATVVLSLKGNALGQGEWTPSSTWSPPRCTVWSRLASP